MAHLLVAKLEGGGYERPDADKQLPLDINYAKLGEWLVRPQDAWRRCSRGHRAGNGVQAPGAAALAALAAKPAWSFSASGC